MLYKHKFWILIVFFYSLISGLYAKHESCYILTSLLCFNAPHLFILDRYVCHVIVNAYIYIYLMYGCMLSFAYFNHFEKYVDLAISININ